MMTNAVRLLTGALALVALVACGGDPEDTLSAFDVTLRTSSDCSQVGQGGVNCESEEDLLAVSTAGRWVFDYRGVDTFVLTTHTGKTVAGVYFRNDGRVTTRACEGQGGICHFARTRFTTSDANSECEQITERVVDVVAGDDGRLFGQMTDVSFTAETCGTSLITEVIIDVSGDVAEEPVRAREGLTP